MAEFIDPAIVPKVTLPSGEEVPCMGMGTFGSDRVSAEEVSAAVAGAIRSGYRMFDCAACYGNEHQIGEVFEAAIKEESSEWETESRQEEPDGTEVKDIA